MNRLRKFTRQFAVEDLEEKKYYLVVSNICSIVSYFTVVSQNVVPTFPNSKTV